MGVPSTELMIGRRAQRGSFGVSQTISGPGSGAVCSAMRTVPHDPSGAADTKAQIQRVLIDHGVGVDEDQWSTHIGDLNAGTEYVASSAKRSFRRHGDTPSRD